MKSVNQQVQAIIDKDIAVQKCLRRGIINTRSLARDLIKSHNLPHSTDAVISALRRYDVDEISLSSSKEASDLFNKMAVSTKDGVARILLRDSAFKEISDDYLNKKLLKNNFRIVRAKETITLIVNQRDIEKKLALFKASDVLETEKDLSEIRLHFPKKIDEIKGILARITAELALRDINIKEVMYSIPDWLVYVKESDLIEAHRSLMELKKA
ncbi:hypothetical protein COV20_02495 [Candidatus Woesearchaeota archaeon CG10_big_fil_rev_8_21_14_0_10_45_16]|nr:MAG: hypothetical protein COV20_02495 [Candidatus Woesearchaeota archaeon CG10_big_fil_rev_8_21_14_0_10_45_16]